MTKNAGYEIAGHENTRHEFARQDKNRMKMNYVTLECAFFYILNVLYVRPMC